MTEPLQIRVGEWNVSVDHFGNLKVRLEGLSGGLSMKRLEPPAKLIAALARELTEARKDVARLTNLIAAGPPGAAPNDMCLSAEAWDLGAGLVGGPEDTDQVVMRKAMDLFCPGPAREGA